MHGGVLVHKDEERYRPDDADDAENIEDRWPAIVESILGQQTGQRHRDDGAKLSAYCNTMQKYIIISIFK